MSELWISRLKWASTACVLTGILLTNLNVFPLNIAIHGTGAIGWTAAGYMAGDKAIMTNFGLQLPLFAIGLVNVMGAI